MMKGSEGRGSPTSIHKQQCIVKVNIKKTAWYVFKPTVERNKTHGLRSEFRITVRIACEQNAHQHVEYKFYTQHKEEE